jgi:stage II sporulation protein D
MGIGDIDWPVTVSSSENVLDINDKSYRGQAIVHRVKEKFVVVNKVNIEDYLRGVVPYELRTPEFEALKAQTVAARSFGLRKSLRTSRGADGEQIKRMYDLRSTVADQVYGGKKGESKVTDRAVKETRGVVCTYNGKVINAMYSSTCGGKTQDGKKPYLTSRPCRFCEVSPHYRWEHDYTLSDISQRMGKKVTNLKVSTRDKTGRAESVRVSAEGGDYNLSGNNLRSKLGLKSRFYDIRMSNSGIKITGRGYGHGIGLCQYGAVGLARKGYNYRSILKYYYKGAKIKRMY